MGGAASIETGPAESTNVANKATDTFDGMGSGSGPSHDVGIHRRLKRENIFDRQSIANFNKDGHINDPETGDKMDKDEYDLVSKSFLVNFFFLQQSDAESAQKKMDSLITRKKREKKKADVFIIKEGGVL